MHYLLNDQSYYFPSSNDQTYPLQQFLQNLEHNFPIIVRISSSNIHERSIKHLLSRNIPLLLLTGYQFQSILSEYHPPNDGRHRLSITQGKLLPKKTTKFRTMRKLSKSLVTIATSNLREENNMDDNENCFNTRTIARNINEKRSNIVPLCRIPLSYSGYFEILNENDQAIEPVHQISDLLMIEYHNDEKNQQIRTEKWPQAFILRCQCQAYTKRYIPDEGKLSGSTDSCYGSLSDLDSQKTPLILNDNKETLQPGQILTILNSCFAYRSQISEQESKLDEYPLQSPTTSWLRTKSRFFFPRKKSQPTSNNSTKNIYDIPKISQTYLKCRTQQGDIVYISTDETGLFSPVYTPNRRSSSIVDSKISMYQVFFN
ncbi:hypothetical protein I4U23_018157 [Adineta vaga]|nr:hypothetical protein I4U23_018157 [Adineta vaga]